jgi:hypothetical protein
LLFSWTFRDIQHDKTVPSFQSGKKIQIMFSFNATSNKF